MISGQSRNLPAFAPGGGHLLRGGSTPARTAPDIDWLKGTYYTLAILVILLGGYKGLLKLRRDAVADAVSRKIFAVTVSASEPDSVQKLTTIRSEID